MKQKEIITSLYKQFNILSEIAVNYNKKILDAKSSLKKQLYKKKLSKVNKQVLAILAQLEIYNPNTSSVEHHMEHNNGQK